MNERIKGIVSSYKRGYGFIQGEDGNSYFAHHSAIKMEGFRKLKAGQEVSFTVGEDPEGRVCAKDIEVKDGHISEGIVSIEPVKEA